MIDYLPLDAPFPFDPLPQRQVSLAGEGYVPSEQNVHVLEPGPGAYEPAGHALQARAPGNDDVPAGHGKHRAARPK